MNTYSGNQRRGPHGGSSQGSGPPSNHQSMRVSQGPPPAMVNVPPQSRIPEMLEQAKMEFEAVYNQLSIYKVERDQFERQMQTQLQEMEQMQQTYKSLESSHRRIRQQYEEDMMRLRRQLDAAGVPTVSSTASMTNTSNKRIRTMDESESTSSRSSLSGSGSSGAGLVTVLNSNTNTSRVGDRGARLPPPSSSSGLISSRQSPSHHSSSLVSTISNTLIASTKTTVGDVVVNQNQASRPSSAASTSSVTPPALSSLSSLPQQQQLAPPSSSSSSSSSLPMLSNTLSSTVKITTSGMNSSSSSSQSRTTLLPKQQHMNTVTSIIPQELQTKGSTHVKEDKNDDTISNNSGNSMHGDHHHDHSGDGNHDHDDNHDYDNDSHSFDNGSGPHDSEVIPENVISSDLGKTPGSIPTSTALSSISTVANPTESSAGVGGGMSTRSGDHEINVNGPQHYPHKHQRPSTNNHSNHDMTNSHDVANKLKNEMTMTTTSITNHKTSTTPPSMNPGNTSTSQAKVKWTITYNSKKNNAPDGSSGQYSEHNNLFERPHVEMQHTLDHHSVVCCVRFSSDGSMMASGCHKTAQVFDVATSKEIFSVTRPDVSLSAAGTSGTSALDGEDAYVRAVCFSPDGKTLVAGMPQHVIRTWNIETKQEGFQLNGHESEIYSLDYVHNLIASGSGDRKVRLWDGSNGQCHAVFGSNDTSTGPADGVTSVAISPDGRLVAAASLDKIVRIWDTTTTKLMDQFEGHSDSVYSIAFSPDGKNIISGSLDRTLMLWEVSGSGQKSTRPKLLFQGHKDFVLSVAYTPDGRWLMSGSKDRTVVFWDPRTTRSMLTLSGYRNSVISVASSPSSPHFATGSGDCFACIWKYQRQTL